MRFFSGNKKCINRELSVLIKVGEGIIDVRDFLERKLFSLFFWGNYWCAAINQENTLVKCCNLWKNIIKIGTWFPWIFFNWLHWITWEKAKQSHNKYQLVRLRHDFQLQDQVQKFDLSSKGRYKNFSVFCSILVTMSIYNKSMKWKEWFSYSQYLYLYASIKQRKAEVGSSVAEA